MSASRAQSFYVGALISIALRDRWPGPDIVRKIAQRTGITWVGPALDHPINEVEYRRVFASLIQDRADAILVSEEPVNITNRKLIAKLAEESRLPAMYPLKVFVEAGG